ncbi:unnamed protein product, partial [marine sediment metagenome]
RVAWKGLIPITLALFVLAAVLLYFGMHRSVWALVGNVVILAVMLSFAATSRIEVTGRAATLPPIGGGAISRSVPQAGVSA